MKKIKSLCFSTGRGLSPSPFSYFSHDSTIYVIILFLQAAVEIEVLETKSVAESDSGRLCGDVLSSATSDNAPDSVYNEPSLSDIIVENYEGGRSKTGHFEGYGEAVFLGGNKYKVR